MTSVLVEDAQREIRTVFRGGFVSQLVAALLWWTSAGLATWSTPERAIVTLVVGGFVLFPLTTLGLRLMGGPGLDPENPLGALGMQVAFVLPLTLPVVAAAALYRLDWFYPAFMVVLGAHYLPFTFLYGMRMFAVLSGLLVASGVLLARNSTDFGTGAWVTGAILIVFAVLGLVLVRREERSDAGHSAAVAG